MQISTRMYSTMQKATEKGQPMMSYIDVLPYIPPVDLMTFAENITSHILRFLNDPTTEHIDWLHNYIDEYL